MDWIDVQHNQPHENGKYLTVIDRKAPENLGGNKTYVCITRYINGKWRTPVHIPRWINDEITDTVTHWQPLPPLPNESKE